MANCQHTLNVHLDVERLHISVLMCKMISFSCIFPETFLTEFDWLIRRKKMMHVQINLLATRTDHPFFVQLATYLSWLGAHEKTNVRRTCTYPWVRLYAWNISQYFVDGCVVMAVVCASNCGKMSEKWFWMGEKWFWIGEKCASVSTKNATGPLEHHQPSAAVQSLFCQSVQCLRSLHYCLYTVATLLQVWVNEGF